MVAVTGGSLLAMLPQKAWHRSCRTFTPTSMPGLVWDTGQHIFTDCGCSHIPFWIGNAFMGARPRACPCLYYSKYSSSRKKSDAALLSTDLPSSRQRSPAQDRALPPTPALAPCSGLLMSPVKPR